MTYRDRVATLFKDRPFRWIDGRQRATIGGAYAWRTRLTECRTELRMDIRNRQRRVNQVVVSEYRYCPPAQPGLFDD